MRRKRNWIVGVFVACIVLALFWSAYQADKNPNLQSVNSTPLTPATIDLMGSWMGERNNVLNIRSDGSGRSRLTNAPAKGVSYFEYRFDRATKEFTMIETSDSLLAKARDRLIGEDSFGFTIRVINENEFDLVNSLNGETQRFIRTRDRLVESAP